MNHLMEQSWCPQKYWLNLRVPKVTNICDLYFCLEVPQPLLSVVLHYINKFYTYIIT